MNIERQDKQAEPKAEEIVKDWRTWASNNKYTPSNFITLPQGVTLEIWEGVGYLIYLPGIPRTTGGETLYRIDDKDYLDFMLDSLKKMVAVSSVMVAYKSNTKNAHLN